MSAISVRHRGRKLWVADWRWSRRAVLCGGVVVIGTAVCLMPRGQIRSMVSRSHRSAFALLPLSARGPVSSVLGASDPIYRVVGLFARNPGQGFSARFSDRGVSFSSGKARAVGLSLIGFGHGSREQEIRPVAPVIRGNLVRYRYPGLVDSFVNGPLGVEQTITIARRPRGAGSLILGLSVTGAHVARSGTAAVLSAAGMRLRYSGLRVLDQRGRVLQAWIRVRRGKVQLVVDDKNAAYPLRIDPFIQQGLQLTGDTSDYTGVTLSSDGDTALVGDDLFVRTGSTWTLQASHLLSGSGGGVSVSSVAVSGDGNTVLVGWEGMYGGSGAVWVITRSGSTWTQQSVPLHSSGEVGDGEFGSSVALSADGNTALIGGRSDNGGVGAAWVFTRSGSTWTQDGGKLLAMDEVGDGYFGSTVALSADGNAALIGGEDDNGGVGAAWVFAPSGVGWAQDGSKLTGDGEVGDGYLGSSVALSADGNTALIGGSGDNGGVGAAWVLTRSGSTWAQQGSKLTGNGEVGDGGFGSGVALSADGNTALIGGSGDNGGVGAAWVLTRSGSTWAQQGSKLTGNGEVGDGGFGSDVALSSDGYTGLVEGADAGGWVFVLPPAVSSISPEVGSTLGGTTVTIEGSGFDEVNGVSFGGTPAQSFTVVSPSEITAVAPPDPAGVTDVTVVSSHGTSATSATDEFDYKAPATQITATLSNPSINADGKSTTTVTATIEDSEGHPVPDDRIVFSSTDPVEIIGPTTANGNGTYTAVITASTTVGAVTITATDTSVSPAIHTEVRLQQTGATDSAELAQITRLLQQLLAILEQQTKTNSIARSGTATAVFVAPSGGQLVIKWYYKPTGSKSTEIVASGTDHVARAGKSRVKIALTRAGRNLFRRHSKLRVVTKVSFTPTGAQTVTRQKTMTVKKARKR